MYTVQMELGQLIKERAGFEIAPGPTRSYIDHMIHSLLVLPVKNNMADPFRAGHYLAKISEPLDHRAQSPNRL